MQALWSRAARNRASCRCIQCAHTVSSIARRAGPVRYNGPANLQARIPSALYSTITTADLADGSFEDDSIVNEKERDRPLAKAKLTYMRKSGFTYVDTDIDNYEKAFTLGEDVIADEESITFLPGVTLLHEVLLRPRQWDRVAEFTANELDWADKPHTLVPVETGLDPSMWDALVVDSRFPGSIRPPWPVNTGRDITPHNLPPQSLWSLDYVRVKALRKRQTWKKLAIQELSMGMLICSLLDHAPLLGESQTRLAPGIQRIVEASDFELWHMQSKVHEAMELLQKIPDDIPDDQRVKIKEMMQELDIKPKYSQDSDGHFYDVCEQMNTVLKEIFASIEGNPNEKEVQLALGKIAHNLLVCSAGPDVHTFNILIAGLRRWNFTKLVSSTIAALDACKIRPNEITCALILDFYIQQKEPTRFIKFVRLMRGVGNALMLARPDININEAGNGRLVRPFGKVHKVYQKIHPTPLVFDTLMRGVLQFAGLDRALEIYYEMKADGWGLSVLGLTDFLVECIRGGDWISGLYVWEEISSLKEAAEIPHLLTAYSHMLSLCTVTGNKRASNHLLKEVSNWGLDRKEIINTSMRITEDLRQEQVSRGQPSTQAPARNEKRGSIAQQLPHEVSNFVAQGGPSKPAAPTEPIEPRKADIPTDTPNDVPSEVPTEFLTEPSPPPAPVLSKDELWQLWLQNELGLWKNRKAPAPLPNIEPVQPSKNPSLTERLQQELKERKVHPAPVDPRAVMSQEELWQLWRENELGLWKNRKAPAPLPTVGPAPLFTSYDPVAATLKQDVKDKKTRAKAEVAPLSLDSKDDTLLPEDVVKLEAAPTEELMTPFSFLHSLVFGDKTDQAKKPSKEEEEKRLDFIRKMIIPKNPGATVWRPDGILKAPEGFTTPEDIKQDTTELNNTATTASEDIKQDTASFAAVSDKDNKLAFEFINQHFISKKPGASVHRPEILVSPEILHQIFASTPSPVSAKQAEKERAERVATANAQWDSWRRQFLSEQKPNTAEKKPQAANANAPYASTSTSTTTTPQPGTQAQKPTRTLNQLIKIKDKKVCASCFRKGHTWKDADAPCKGKDPLPFGMFKWIVEGNQVSGNLSRLKRLEDKEMGKTTTKKWAGKVERNVKEKEKE